MSRRLSKREWKRALDMSRASTDDFVAKLKERHMPITPTIVCMYTCHGCGLTKIPVTVPAREQTQDIVEFTKTTAHLLGADHCRISPHCPVRKIDVYIPLPDDDSPIGSATRQ